VKNKLKTVDDKNFFVQNDKIVILLTKKREIPCKKVQYIVK